ncbi:MAG: hypothetical protein AB9869_31005 [Verrucomicrobiia bacterium]
MKLEILAANGKALCATLRTLRALTLALALSCFALGPVLPARGEVSDVVVVFKTHFDIGYTDFASNVVQRYRTSMIDQALAVVDQNRAMPPAQQFVWTIPGWPMARIAEDWSGQTEERQRRILEAFKSGRFATHALPFSTHTELLEMEDLVHGIGYASRLARAASLPLPRDAKMTDVPCHSWFMPTLLRHAGVDFLHLGCNAASRSPEVPPLFWWEGPDGSRLLTMYSASGYGTGLVPAKDWPHKTWLALIHTGDNHGPPRPDEVATLLAEAAQKLPNVRVRIGRLSDFADALLAEKPDLPVIRGDMPDTWIHGPMCDPDGARLARTLRPLISTSATLDTLMDAWGLDAPDVAPALAAAAENSLLYGEHTWGGAFSWVTQYSAKKRLAYGDEWKALRAQGKYDRLEASWEEHSAYIRKAESAVKPALESQLRTLAAGVKRDGPRIVVFNPLPWTRTGLVTLSMEGIDAEAVEPAEGGELSALDRRGAEGTFVARDIPPLGYRTYVPTEPGRPTTALKGDVQSGVLESPYFQAKIDPARGTVRSLIDKASGRELIDHSAPEGLGQFLYERFDSNQVQRFVTDYVKITADWATNELGKPNLPLSSEVPYQALSPANFQVAIRKGALSVTAQMDAAPQRMLPATTTRLILYRDLPFADVEITLHQKAADPWPEAGWLCFPLNVVEPRYHLGRLGSIIDPAKDIVPGANRHLLALNTGLCATDSSGTGVGLCPLDNPIVSLDEPGCWKFSRDDVPKRSRVYVNLFNNQWTTNFRLWNGGTWTARVRLWTVDRYAPANALITPSMEARFPLLAAAAGGGAGRLPLTQTGLRITGARAYAVLGANSDGPGSVLRLWEQSGVSGECVVQLPDGMRLARVQPVDLRGTPRGAPIPLRDGAFSAHLKAFAPAVFRLERQP